MVTRGSGVPRGTSGPVHHVHLRALPSESSGPPHEGQYRIFAGFARMRPRVAHGQGEDPSGYSPPGKVSAPATSSQRSGERQSRERSSSRS